MRGGMEIRMKEKTRKLITKIIAIAMAAFMCVGTVYYLVILFI